MEVEKESTTFLSLADSGSFTTLDIKLSAAAIGASTGVVGQEITTEAEKASQQCRLLRGRQALWLVYRWYATNQEQGAMFEMIDLMAVKSANITLPKFLANWEAVVTDMVTPPSEDTKRMLFYKQIKDIQVLNYDICKYNRMSLSDPEKTYQYLMDSCTKYINRERQEDNRSAIEAKLSGNARSAAAM